MGMFAKYGADTLRLWMYSVNAPGDSKNFDEKTVAELHNKVFNLLGNVVSFYELYRDPAVELTHCSFSACARPMDKCAIAAICYANYRAARCL